MKLMRRVLAMALAVVLIAGSLDLGVFAKELEMDTLEEEKEELTEVFGQQEETEVMSTKTKYLEEGKEVYIVEDIIVDLGDVQTTVLWDKEDEMSSSSIQDGKVELIDKIAVNWIDRLDLSGEAEVIRSFYDALVEATNNDGIDDELIEEQYFFNNAYMRVAEVTGWVATAEEATTELAVILQSYAPYIRAAYDAFDRDYPQVFWLGGSTSCGVGGTYAPNPEGGYDYSFVVKFYLKTSDFDVRDSKYQNQDAIKSAIVTKERKVQQLVQGSKGMSVVERIDYFNDYLTTSNQYNTSYNLSNIGHDCRECVSALEGRIGTVGPVCEAYARAFKVLCDEVGIPCVLVDGEAKSSASGAGESHMWNYVQVEGQWYGMDVTWNDPTVKGSKTAVSGYESDKWSLVGSQTYPEGSSLKFIESHQVLNRVSLNGVNFSNGPVLEDNKYVDGMSSYGKIVEKGSCGSLTWTVYDSSANQNNGIVKADTLVISGKGEMADYVSVTEVPWYSYRTSIEKIIVEDGVTVIGNYAFTDLENVTSITIPQKVTRIGKYAFTNLPKAEGLFVPQTVTEIGEKAYYNCRKLSELKIPTGMKKIEAHTFENCNLISQIVIPSNIISIGEEAFSGTSLTTVYISKRSNTISGAKAFAGLNDTTIYFESTPITEFESVKLKAPYTISYRKNGNLSTIVQVYADGLQSYTIKETDLPSTIGEWYALDLKESEVKAGTLLEKISDDITIVLHPFKLTKQPENIEVVYGSETSKILSVAMQKDSDVNLSYQWYKGSTAVQGANTLTMSVPEGLEVGKHSYRLKVTYEDYSVYSENATITVTPADLSKGEVEVTGDFVYDGTEKIPSTSQVKIMLNGKMIPREVYDISIQNNINAGMANITVTAKENTNYTGTISSTFVIQPMEIEISSVQITSKMYDGTKEAQITKVFFVKAESEQEIVLNQGTDYQVTATFVDAMAGNKKDVAVQTVLKNSAAKNYKLVAENKVVHNGEILKAVAPVSAVVTQKYIYSQNHVVSVDMSQWLPQLEDDRAYGEVSYKANETKGTLLEASPVVKGKILEYVVKSGTKGAKGEITITVTAENYQSFQIVLNLELDDQIEISKVEGILRIPEGKTSYVKKYGDSDFTIEVESNDPENLVYTVLEGCSMEGEYKNVNDILSVNTDGVVTILGSGKVKVQISLPETQDHTAAEPVTVEIVINKLHGFRVENISDQIYTGKAICPEPSIYDGESEKYLVKGKDYVISYKNNVNVSSGTMVAEKMPMVIVTGKGNYSSQVKVTFHILPKDIAKLDVMVSDIYLTENGKVQKKVPVVTYNGKKLKAGTDMTVTYLQEGEGVYQNSGVYTAKIEGKGNYIGERKFSITLTEKGYLIDKVSVKKIPTLNLADYNGKVVLDDKDLVVSTTIHGKKVVLEEGKDYETIYENNNKAGTATVTIRGINSYSGVKKVNFKINGISIAKAQKSEISTQIFNGKPLEPEVKVTLSDGTVLKKGIDYTISYAKNDKVGMATYTIKGMGTYSGSIAGKFKIEAYDLTGETNAYGEVKEGSLLREEGGLLTLADGELSVKFIKGGNKPEVNLSLDGVTLVNGKDYKLTYKNNKMVYNLKEGDSEYNKAKAPAIIIKGKGNFKGTITRLFVIEAKSLSDGVKIEIGDKVATTKAGGYISKPVLTDEDGNKLVVGKDYSSPVYLLDGVELGKKDKVEAGKEIMVKISGKGNYTGQEVTACYRITLKDFTKIKAGTITKVYKGDVSELTAMDFYDTAGLGKIISKEGKKLEYGANKDFVIVEGSYKNNDKKGTATVTLKGCGEYGGMKTIKFKIVSKEIEKY